MNPADVLLFGTAFVIAQAGSCRSTGGSRDPTPSDAPPVVAAPRAVIVPITAHELRADVEFLASDARGGRATPSDGLEQAARHIAEAFAAAGLQALPRLDGYEMRFDCDGHGAAASANVLAYRPGADAALRDDAVIVSAHYDHIGLSTDEGPDSIYNGANDNASGVAVMLAVARQSSTWGHRRSLVFIAFCGEELGLLGSEYYVAHPPWPLARTPAVVNLEMLGRPAPGPPLLAWITGHERSTLPRAFQDSETTEVSFVSAHDIGHTEGGAFDRSDNYPFALAGVVAHTIASGRIDGYYHALDDEAATLDYDRMALIAEAVAKGVRRLADQDEVPQWIETTP